MSAPRFLESIVDKLHGSATVRAVYGDPIEAGGKTIIPVARVFYGLGGGYGSGTASDDDQRQGPSSGEGGGGGGGAAVSPLGVIEITRDRTRFLPIRSRATASAGAFLAGLALGVLIGSRRH